MSAPEFHLQKAICELLTLRYPEAFFFSVPNGAVLCSTKDPAERLRAKREMAKLKVSGLRNGVPDMAVYWAGGHGLIELKSERGRLSPEQRSIHQALISLGVRVAVVRSIDDMIATLATWGVRPGRLAA